MPSYRESSQRLGEYVRLFIGVDKFDGDVSTLRYFTCEMTIYLNIFGKDKIKKMCHACLVVSYKMHLRTFFKFQVFEELFQPDELTSD